MTEKFRFTIEGLDCPHCALELEKNMKNHESFSDVSINFPLKTLIVVSHIDDEDEVLAICQKYANDFEDGITIEFKE